MQILSQLSTKVDTREKQILQVLSDKDCLVIINMVKENAMNASMIYSRCNISPSTAYRKLKLLQQLNLLNVTYTIQPNGKKSMSFQGKTTKINILLCKDQLQIHTNFVPLE